MFDAINRLFTKQEPTTEPVLDKKLAVAALLVHLAAVDGEFSDDEREMVSGILKDHFELDTQAVEKLIIEATRKDDDAVDFYKFTSILSKLEEEERVEIIRIMWQVVFTDQTNHELEDNMVWRVAELIGVSSRQRTILRSQMKRA